MTIYAEPFSASGAVSLRTRDHAGNEVDGNIINMTGNISLTMPQATPGREFKLLVRQDATGSRTITWPASVKVDESSASQPSATPSRSTLFALEAIDNNSWLLFRAGSGYAA